MEGESEGAVKGVRGGGGNPSNWEGGGGVRIFNRPECAAVKIKSKAHS